TGMIHLPLLLGSCRFGSGLLIVVCYQAENRRKRAPTFFADGEGAGDTGGEERRLWARAGGDTIPESVHRLHSGGGQAMSLSNDSRTSAVLQAAQAGDRQAAAELLPLVYDELRKLAAHKLAHQTPGQTIQPTALVHEAYLRIAGDGTVGW